MKNIYEVDGYGDAAKTEESTREPDYYLQDVFYQTRPEVFNFDKDPGEGDPFFKNYTDDSEIKFMENNEFDNNYNPSSIADYSRMSSLVRATYRLLKQPLSLSQDDFKLNNTNIKVAVPLRELMNKNNWLKQKASSCHPQKIFEDRKNRLWRYKVTCSGKDSKPGGHEVMLQLANDQKEKDITLLDVRVSCSCPYFKYHGPMYNSQKGREAPEGFFTDKGKLFTQDGKPLQLNRSPDKTDPAKINLICKHIFAVSKKFEEVVSRFNLDVYKDIDSVIKKLSKESFENQVFHLEMIIDFLRNKKLVAEVKDLNSFDSYVQSYKKSKKDYIFNTWILVFLEEFLSELSLENIRKISSILDEEISVQVDSIATDLNTSSNKVFDTLKILKNKLSKTDSATIKNLRKNLSILVDNVRSFYKNTKLPKDTKFIKLVNIFQEVTHMNEKDLSNNEYLSELSDELEASIVDILDNIDNIKTKKSSSNSLDSSVTRIVQGYLRG